MSKRSALLLWALRRQRSAPAATDVALRIRELNLASPLCHEGQHGGSISSESCESQVGMKRGKECGDGSLTVSYSIRCQLDQLIRNNFLSRASLSFEGREAPSFSLTGSAEGARVLIHLCFMACFGPRLQAKISRSFGLKVR
jgi:hypothetical protein